MSKHLSLKPSFTLRPREFYGIRGWAGKPVHPMLTGFPIVGYLLAAVFDIASLIARNLSLSWANEAFIASTWAMVAGFLISILTATTGLLDWPATTKGTQVRRTLNAHATVMVTATLLALATVLLRLHWWPGMQGTVLSITVMTVLVAVLVLTGAWIGNDLVFEHGFRVEPARNTPAWEPSEVDILPGGQALDRYRWHWRANRRESHVRQGRPTVESTRVKTATSDSQRGGADDVPTKLRQLARLRDDGIITAQDFDTKKGELLRRM
jgi:uncharacterized membrane protein